MRVKRFTAVVLGAVLASGVARALPDEAVSLAILTSMTHIVRVQVAGAAAVTAAEPGMKLAEGTKVLTLEAARCELRFTDGHLLKLGPLTTVMVARLPRKSKQQILVHLLTGSVKALIDRFVGKDNDFGLYGATTITAVKGTGYEMTRDSKDHVTVAVDEGQVDVAELKDENDLSSVDRLFLAALLGKVGTLLPAGKMLDILPGQPFPTLPVPIPKNFPSPFSGLGQHDGNSKSPSGPSMPGLGGGGFGFP